MWPSLLVVLGPVADMLSSLFVGFCLLAGALAQNFNFVSRPQAPPNSCVTPQGQQGQCLLINDCPPLFSLYRESRTLETRIYLEGLTCPSTNRYARFCCTGNRESGTINTKPAPQLTPRPTPRPTTRPTLGPTPRPTAAPRQVSLQSMVDASGEGNLQQHRNLGLLPQDDCGLEIVTRIYGGNDTSLGEFPWTALLQYEKNGQRSFECGGALISARYVLTAAHCSNKGTIGMSRLVGVRLGEHDTTKNPDCIIDEICVATKTTCPDICANEPLDFTIEEEIVHPQYRSTSRNQFNDIALLRISRPAAFTDYIRPICVPLTTTITKRVLTATGWGRTSSGTKSSVKLKANLPFVGVEECGPLYARSRRNVTSLQLCAGGVEGVDVCSGDSGGPLMSLELFQGEARYFVTGIVSYGSNMCHFGVPGVYTKVAAYAGWILDQLRS